MSIYDNNAGKVYLDLKPPTPKKPQECCLKKLTEIKASLLDKIEVHEELAKNITRFNTIASVLDTGLIISTVITERFTLLHLKALLVLH